MGTSVKIKCGVNIAMGQENKWQVKYACKLGKWYVKIKLTMMIEIWFEKKEIDNNGGI